VLTKHLFRQHNLLKSEYDGQTIAQELAETFSCIGKENGEGHGEAKSRGILASASARMSRHSNMIALNRSDEGRKRSSEAAKRTSARSDILKKRSERLKQWRDNNREEFYEKCTKKMHAVWHSKPEIVLFDTVKDIEGFNFRHNQVVKSSDFTNKSHRKQIDIADKTRRVYIEFDGMIHFSPIKGQHIFDTVQLSDEMLDRHIEKNGWTLVRISYDQFSYRNGGHFIDSCLQSLLQILKDPKPGIFRIGSAYLTLERLGLTSSP